MILIILIIIFVLIIILIIIVIVVITFVVLLLEKVIVFCPSHVNVRIKRVKQTDFRQTLFYHFPKSDYDFLLYFILDIVGIPKEQ